MVQWNDLVAEYGRGVIGDRMLEEISTVAEAIARKYPPAVYASTGVWTEESFGDLGQDVVEALLANDRRELRYIMETAASVSDFRGLLGKNVRRVLSHKRRRTVVDNLLDRARLILGAPPFLAVGRIDGRVAYATRSDAPCSAPSPMELRAAAEQVKKIPRTAPARGSRAPVVYPDRELRQVLAAAAGAVPGAFSERDLARILEDVLAAWIPIVVEDDAEVADVGDERLEADESDARSVAEEALLRMDPVQRRALALWQNNVTQDEIADELGCSRPTARNRIREAIRFLQESFVSLPPDEQRVAVEAVSLALDEEVT